MQSKRTRDAVYTQDRDGAAIVLVPLANRDEPAKLYAEDWERLMREKVSPRWTLNSGARSGYVRCSARGPGGLDTVARLIMQAGAGEVVGYRTHDRLNLRRENLHIKRRSVGRRVRAES